MNRIRAIVFLALCASALPACASAQKESDESLREAIISGRLAELENQRAKTVSPAELASAMKEVQENFRTSFGPSALKAISADTEVLAKRIMAHEDWLAILEARSTKPKVTMPAPAWKPGNLAEFNRDATTCILASQHNFREGRISLAWFWLDQCAGDLGRHPGFVADWLRANAGEQTFRDWAVSQFAGREQSSP